jgi:hypothetical protein
MFKVRDYVHDFTEVPSTWIFEYYLNLSQQLHGQTVLIRSVFNSKDKNPSLSIYYNRHLQQYRFKCFSTGIGGSAIDLMQHLWKVDFHTATKKIIDDYVQFINSGKSFNRTIYEGATWRVKDYTPRIWNTNDAKYWTPFNIDSKLLEKYNVVPLDNYVMFRKKGSECQDDESFITKSEYIYGFFNRDGKLYKIYRPLDKERKFLKIGNYLQGLDQLEMLDYLVIVSSLKDIMCMKSLGFKVDLVAPDSENSTLSEQQIDEFKANYKAVITLFDNDDAGIKNMKKYEELYKLPFVYLPMSKDVSDSVKQFGKEKVLYELAPRLQRAIEKYEEYHPENT